MCFGLPSLILIVLVGYACARTNTFDRRIDYFNEVRLLLILYHILTFTALVPDAQAKFTMGYSCSAVLILGIAVNMVMLIVTPIKILKLKLKLRVARKYKAK